MGGLGSLVVRVCQKVSKSVTSQGRRQGWGETLAREVGGAERGWRVGRGASESTLSEPSPRAGMARPGSLEDLGHSVCSADRRRTLCVCVCQCA